MVSQAQIRLFSSTAAEVYGQPHKLKSRRLGSLCGAQADHVVGTAPVTVPAVSLLGEHGAVPS